MEFESVPAPCQHVLHKLDIHLWDTVRPEIVQKALCDSIREGTIYVKEEHGYDLLVPPGCLNSVDQDTERISGGPAWPAEVMRW